VTSSSKKGIDRPLAGVRVVVGRARHQAGALSAELRKLGAVVIEIPFIEIRKPRSFKPLDTALRNLGTYDWLVLTSANGVDALWQRLAKLGLSQKLPGTLRVAAIGPATKKAIEKRGVTVNVVPKEYVAESVVRSLKNKVKNKCVLLVRAKVARDVIPRELRKAGAQIDVAEAYETLIPESSRKRLQALFKNPARCPHVVTFTSSSSVRNFVELLGGSRAAKRALEGFGRRGIRGSTVQLASIGPVTSSTLRELELKADINAREYTIPGLVDAIVKSASRQLYSLSEQLQSAGTTWASKKSATRWYASI
jgi:uroporphyrinogen-III synthase